MTPQKIEEASNSPASMSNVKFFRDQNADENMVKSETQNSPR